MFLWDCLTFPYLFVSALCILGTFTLSVAHDANNFSVIFLTLILPVVTFSHFEVLNSVSYGTQRI